MTNPTPFLSTYSQLFKPSQTRIMAIYEFFIMVFYQYHFFCWHFFSMLCVYLRGEKKRGADKTRCHNPSINCSETLQHLLMGRRQLYSEKEDGKKSNHHLITATKQNNKKTDTHFFLQSTGNSAWKYDVKSR